MDFKALSQNAFKALSQATIDFDKIEPLRASSSEEEDSVEYLQGWHNPQSMQSRPFLSLRNFLLIQLSVFALYSFGLFVVLGKQKANCKNAPGLMYCKYLPHSLCLSLRLPVCPIQGLSWSTPETDTQLGSRRDTIRWTLTCMLYSTCTGRYPNATSSPT